MLHPTFRREIRLIGAMLMVTAVQLCGSVSVLGNNDAIRFAENANIALRRTAHQLLLSNGDSVSHIPPVKQLDSHTFSVQVDKLFNYEKLPVILKQSLAKQGISQGYDVIVTSCGSTEPKLGYSFLDLGKSGGVPCAGRAREAGCFTIQVRFVPAVAAAASGTGSWLLMTVSALAVLGLIVWKNRTGRKVPAGFSPAPGRASSGITVGQSLFDQQNQSLTCGEVTHALTYREAKLLSLFVAHANAVLDRDFILKSVWEDEGILVGRSVDVFVSRLRKLLAGDPHIKINAVHGIGYRMEIRS